MTPASAPTQLTLDDALAARERDAAMVRVDCAADTTWRDVALEAVRRVAMARREFTTDAVLERLERETAYTHEMRALGPVMSRAQKAGWIEPTQRFENSAAVSRHKAPKRVWRSRLA